VVAGLATRLRSEEGQELPPGYGARWQQTRARLNQRREARQQQRRFRRDPVTYLQELEQFNVRLLELQDAKQPDDPVPLFNLGWAYLRLERVEESLRLLGRCLELAPTDFGASPNATLTCPARRRR